MNTYADKAQENKSQSVSTADSQMQNGGKSTFQFFDNRPEAVAQHKLQEMANSSPQAKQAAKLQAMADNHSAQQQQPIQKKENNTGLPDKLKSGIENISGNSMDDVKVHYNSDKPAQLHAHAYAQGTDIHIASGQEKHLPHEAWHVVQQKQGRVKPTMQMKGKVSVNNDAGLEKEADVMGSKALKLVQNTTLLESDVSKAETISNNVVQGQFIGALEGMTDERFAHLLRLPEYGLEDSDQKTVVTKFAEMNAAEMKFYSIGQCVAFAFNKIMGPATETQTPFGPKKVRKSVGPEKEKTLTETVHEGLREGGRAAIQGFESRGQEKVTLYRGDGRTFEELTAAGGMWGRDSGAVPASHARELVSNMVAMSEGEQRDWVQGWKASTKNPLELVPYVATGEEAQKGGNQYKIEAPLEFQALPGDRLFIGTDTGSLETANVIAVKMQGGEVIFVTGIPIEFISPM